MGTAYEVLMGGVAKLPLRGVEVMSAVEKGEDGESSDWEEQGVTGVGVEEDVAVDEGRCRGRGEVLVLVLLEMESHRLSVAVASPKDERLEMELRRLEEEQRRRPRELTEGFSPLSHISVTHTRKV